MHMHRWDNNERSVSIIHSIILFSTSSNEETEQQQTGKPVCQPVMPTCPESPAPLGYSQTVGGARWGSGRFPTPPPTRFASVARGAWRSASPTPCSPATKCLQAGNITVGTRRRELQLKELHWCDALQSVLVACMATAFTQKQPNKSQEHPNRD